ncbi:Carboxylesterase type B protein [Rutstroemia sp. NJR-2017a BBW]|nr:Carboxylesterase type B protein [Rutstroemia sp. NJR-2017a BBW]
MRYCDFALLYLLISSAIFVSARSNVKAEKTPIVFLEESKVSYHGVLSGTVEHFHNVKFAEDTSGENRFAPPKPFTPPAGTVIDASLPGPACPQLTDAMPPFFSQIEEISEDCLNLHIARPANLDISSSSNLPVVVWIHGGGVVKGSNSDPHFDPDRVIDLSVADGKPIIYVAINYRLSIFGFARLPILKDAKSLNVGMRDQRAALEWVRDNIQSFGGDPTRITAYGLSAGGTFISLQTMAYGGDSGAPFQQAWVMSGPPGTALNITSDATEHHTRAVAQKIGCGGLEDPGMLACLRKLSMQELIGSAMEYSIANHPPAGLFTFIPSVDEDFIPDRQSNLMRMGKFVRGIRMILGWTQDDGAMNAGPGHLIATEEDMILPIKQFSHALSSQQFTKLFSLYTPSDFEEEKFNYDSNKDPADPEISVHYFRLSRILRDILFTCSSIDFGYHMVKHTQKDMEPDFSGVRLYDLNQSTLTPLWKGAGMPYVRVSHGSDTNYIFNGVCPELQLSREDQELSELFTRSLVNFAYTGHPLSQSKEQTQFEEWPESYGIVGAREDDEVPRELNIEVIGGPYGTGSVHLTEQADGGMTPEVEMMQQVLADPVHFGYMDSFHAYERRRQMEQEKLFERCAYINSLAETLDV